MRDVSFNIKFFNYHLDMFEKCATPQLQWTASATRDQSGRQNDVIHLMFASDLHLGACLCFSKANSIFRLPVFKLLLNLRARKI